MSLVLSAMLVGSAILSPRIPESPDPVIFALLNEGKTIEPIARVVDGQLKEWIAIDGADNSARFRSVYYQKGKTYTVTSGGKSAGKIAVVSNNPEAECTADLAEVAYTSGKWSFGPFGQSLATSLEPANSTSGLRRASNATEKSSLDKLALSALQKQGFRVSKLKKSTYTIVNADNDNMVEAVGTCVAAPEARKRILLFFIATTDRTGKFSLSFSEARIFTDENTMSGDVTMLDDGVYQEKLLDLLDTDGNGVAEIFSMHDAFEGAGFNAYARNVTTGKWERVFEVGNYHCAY